MFYIRNKNSGLYLSGYCLWVDRAKDALPFSSAIGVNAVASMFERNGVNVSVLHAGDASKGGLWEADE